MCPKVIKDKIESAITDFRRTQFLTYQKYFNCKYNCNDKLSLVLRKPIYDIIINIIIDNELFNDSNIIKFLSKETDIWGIYRGMVQSYVSELAHQTVIEWRSL